MIDVDDVSVRFGDVSVLESLSLSVPRGQFLALVGPNGAGKTTLLRTINGVLEPDSGAVSIDGEDVHGLSSRAASRLVATVPQDTSLSFDFEIRDVVAMGRNPYHSRFERATEGDRAHVDRALDRTATTHLAERSIDAVSGGERQRVLLARALAQDTPVMLLDEPTASLDVNHQVRTLELVADLAEEGATVVAAIHDLDLAARYCDAVAVLSEGEILAAGPPADVLTGSTIETAFDTRAAVTQSPVTGAPTITALSGRTADADGGVSPTTHVIGGGDLGARLLAGLADAGVDASVGPLPPGDVALRTARAHEQAALVAEPFAPIDDETRRELAERVRAAAATVLVGGRTGSDRVLAAADEADRLVVVGTDDAGNDRAREPTDGYEHLRERADIVAIDDAIDVLREILRDA